MSEQDQSRVEEGGCLCGAVRYRAHGDPLFVAHCHCQSCRRASGAALLTFVGYATADVHFTGASRARFQSSPGVSRSFCPRCGTPLAYEADRYPDEVHLTISTFDAPDRFEPRLHVWTEDRIAWLQLDDHLPQYARLSRDG